MKKTYMQPMAETTTIYMNATILAGSFDDTNASTGGGTGNDDVHDEDAGGDAMGKIGGKSIWDAWD